MTRARPRHWIVAGLVGALAVVLIFTFGMTVADPGLADHFGLIGHEAEPGSRGRAAAAMRTFTQVGIASAIIGVPVGLLFTAVMALIERGASTARTLPVWLAAGVAAGLPVVFCLFFLVGGAQPVVLVGDVAGIVGAAIAWWVRHGTIGQLT